MPDTEFSAHLPLQSRGHWDSVLEWLGTNEQAQQALWTTYADYDFSKDECVVPSPLGVMTRVQFGPRGGPKVRTSVRVLMYLVHTKRLAQVQPACSCKGCINPYHQREMRESFPELASLKEKLARAEQ